MDAISLSTPHPVETQDFASLQRGGAINITKLITFFGLFLTIVLNHLNKDDRQERFFAL